MGEERGRSDTDIAGATGASYTLRDADVGSAIKVRESFTDDGGHDEELTSAATAIVAPRPNTLATGAPAISGAAQARETLTASTDGVADADGLSGATFAFQWARSADGSDTDIAGATGASYVLADADVGARIKVRASFTDDAGNREELTRRYGMTGSLSYGRRARARDKVAEAAYDSRVDTERGVRAADERSRS